MTIMAHELEKMFSTFQQFDAGKFWYDLKAIEFLFNLGSFFMCIYNFSWEKG